MWISTLSCWVPACLFINHQRGTMSEWDINQESCILGVWLFLPQIVKNFLLPYSVHSDGICLGSWEVMQMKGDSDLTAPWWCLNPHTSTFSNMGNIPFLKKCLMMFYWRYSNIYLSLWHWKQYKWFSIETDMKVCSC